MEAVGCTVWVVRFVFDDRGAAEREETGRRGDVEERGREEAAEQA